MRQSIDGGVALVTGAGGGLGRVIAQRLAEDGWAVAVNDLRPGPAEETVAGIRAAGGRAEAFAADVTDEAAVTELAESVRARFGLIAVSVANASGPQPAIGLSDLDWADVLAHLEFFVKSPLLLAKAIVPQMRRAGYGRLIHIGSDLFDRGDPGWSGYMAAKGALVGLTRGWAAELGRDAITVNLVAPGWIPVERHGEIPAEVADQWFARQDLPRWGTPADIAGTVAFLASPDAGFITGQRVTVNGGFHYL